MTDRERDCLVSILTETRSYLEFGMGASTALACQQASIQRIDAVESSARFAQKYYEQSEEIRNNMGLGRLVIHQVDIGPVGNWGYPTDESTMGRWRNYPQIVQSLAGQWDTILVDGRFRVACVLHSLMQVDQRCRIVVHDFWNRNGYHEVLNYVNVDASVDSMGVFRRRPECNNDELMLLAAKYY